MVKRVDRLTPEQTARMPEWRDKWIKVGLSTDPMLDGDRAAVEHSIRTMYRKAKLAEPKAIVFVPSPFVLRVAAPIAAGVIYAHRNGWPKGSLESGAVRGAVSRKPCRIVFDARTGGRRIACQKKAARLWRIPCIRRQPRWSRSACIACGRPAARRNSRLTAPSTAFTPRR